MKRHRKAKLADEDIAEIRAIAEHLLVEPVPKKCNLDELVAKITPENLHAEISTGPPCGKEVW